VCGRGGGGRTEVLSWHAAVVQGFGGWGEGAGGAGGGGGGGEQEEEGEVVDDTERNGEGFDVKQTTQDTAPLLAVLQVRGSTLCHRERVPSVRVERGIIHHNSPTTRTNNNHFLHPLLRAQTSQRHGIGCVGYGWGKETHPNPFHSHLHLTVSEEKLMVGFAFFGVAPTNCILRRKIPRSCIENADIF
jgi:hypothetical protein